MKDRSLGNSVFCISAALLGAGRNTQSNKGLLGNPGQEQTCACACTLAHIDQPKVLQTPGVYDLRELRAKNI